jgi:hypothetical protein
MILDQKNKPHYNVVIATPGRSMEAEYVVSLTKTIDYLSKNNISYLFVNQYSSQVNAAREATIMNSKLLNAFCKEPLNNKATYDKIFWIDSDISWTVDNFMQIYNSELDIVSGLYYNESMVPVVLFNKDNVFYDPKSLQNKNMPIEVDGVGFGFVAVKSGVFESIPRPWFETVFEKIKNSDTGEEMFIPFGEDISWCMKAKKAGYSIYLDPIVKVSHHKKIGII